MEKCHECSDTGDLAYRNVQREVEIERLDDFHVAKIFKPCGHYEISHSLKSDTVEKYLEEFKWRDKLCS